MIDVTDMMQAQKEQDVYKRQVFTYDQSLFYSYASSGALNELTDA